MKKEPCDMSGEINVSTSALYEAAHVVVAVTGGVSVGETSVGLGPDSVRPHSKTGRLIASGGTR